MCMARVRRRFSGRLRLFVAGLIVAAAIVGCGGAATGGGTHPAVGALTYTDPQGWSVSYPNSLSLEQSTSGPGMATFTEITVANFHQQTTVVTGRTRDGGFIRVLPPLDRAGRFPADGVAFRMLLSTAVPRRSEPSRTRGSRSRSPRSPARSRTSPNAITRLSVCRTS